VKKGEYGMKRNKVILLQYYSEFNSDYWQRDE